MMMTEKMTSITTDQNEFVSSIQKLSPKAGDVLMFYIKTDEYGTPMMDFDAMRCGRPQKWLGIFWKIRMLQDYF